MNNKPLGTESLELLAEWLRCPNCSRPLNAIDRLILGCDSGHRFDTNKRGYANLIDSRDAAVGDSAAMLEERHSLLTSGLYSPIVSALKRHVPSRTRRIFDVGCGTGFYLHALLDSSRSLSALGMDISPAAVARTVKKSSLIHGVVADTWKPFPIRDGICDLILNVFAPRNSDEFHRTLTDDGTLLTVVPQSDHLHELGNLNRMLKVPPGKAEDVQKRLASHFSLLSIESVRYTSRIDSGQGLQLRNMGPSSHHRDESVFHPPQNVTVAVDVLVFHKRHESDAG